jgi:chorismate synthase
VGVLRFLTAGESHGRALVVVVEGLPAGLPITVDEIGSELARRRLGYGRGPRMRFEADELTLLGGVRHGRTLGSPVAVEIANTEWPRWAKEMDPAPGATEQPLTRPRPGRVRRLARSAAGVSVRLSRTKSTLGLRARADPSP